MLANNTNKSKNRQKRQGKNSKQKRQDNRRNLQQKGNPDALIQVVGGRGTDATAQHNITQEGLRQELLVPSTISKMQTTATIYDRVIPYMAMGFVLSGIRKGWMQTITDPTIDPWYAFQFVIDVFNTGLTGGAPIVQSAPVWMWEVLAALHPKEEPFKTGTIAYTWFVEVSGIIPAAVFEYTSSVAGDYSVCFAKADPGMVVNGYPALLPAIISYNQQTNGVASFNSLCRVFEDRGMTKIILQPTKTSLQEDTSAFAVCYPELGEAWNSNGALATTIYSERQIICPLLAKFANYQDSSQYYRGWHSARKSGGSSSYIPGRIMEFSSPYQLRNKESPIIQFYNFDEFFFTLCQSLAEASLLTVQSGGSAPPSPCPLTVQDAQILLRQAILPVFSNHLAQEVILGGDFFNIVPFSVGPNGCSWGNSSMLLPTLLVENIRCCMRKIIKLKAQKGMKELDVITLLSRPENQPTIPNFQVGSQLLFSVDPSETSIDIIDCSFSSSGNTRYCTFSGSQYDTNVGIWNNWIQTLSGALSPLVSVGAEKGVSALLTSVYTRIQLSNQSFNKKMEKQPSRKKMQIVGRPPSERSSALTVVPTYFDELGERMILCNNAVSSPVFKYISQFILPVTISSQDTNTAGPQCWQSFQIQPYSIPSATILGNSSLANNTVIPSVSSRLVRLASQDIKANYAQQNNELISEIVELGKAGRGGFFASLAAGLANTFLPGTGDVVHSIATGIGF